MKRPKPLNRIDVTHRNYSDPGVQWLINCGYRLKMIGNRVLLERVVQAARSTCQPVARYPRDWTPEDRVFANKLRRQELFERLRREFRDGRHENAGAYSAIGELEGKIQLQEKGHCDECKKRLRYPAKETS